MAVASESSVLERRPTKQKVGHLRVDAQGEITYKKTPSSTLMASLQLGLSHSIGRLEPKPRRDILMTDFDVIETVEFPNGGSDFTQAHKYKDFTFTTYSPVAFRFFREAFQIKAEDYLMALCHQQLRELSNPGASGSLFYLSADDEFIMKTVQKKEAKFLQKLLPGYYLNLTQNKKTLLPKFFGLYQYRCGGVKIRIVVMNNLLPSELKYHWKFDLKGSTYKRRASPAELSKSSPTYKDLDFEKIHPEGLTLSPENHDILIRTLQRDCQVLESFGIMDYSLLLGIFNVDESLRSGEPPPTPTEVPDISGLLTSAEREGESDSSGRERAQTMPAHRRIDARKNFSIISAETTPREQDYQELNPSAYPGGYILARTGQGDRLLLYLGVIDILQSYRVKKRLEHGLKSIFTDGDTVSVHNPTFYSQRFQTFLKGIFKRERVKIRPRRNSTVAQKGSRRSGIIGQTPGRHSPRNQESGPKDGTPSHDPISPMSSILSPPIEEEDPFQNEHKLSIVESDASFPKETQQTTAPSIEPLNLTDLLVSVNEGVESRLDLDDFNTVMNSSTPLNESRVDHNMETELENKEQEIVETSVSIIVHDRRSNTPQSTTPTLLTTAGDS